MTNSISQSTSSNSKAGEVHEHWINSGGFATRYLEAGDRSNDPVLLIHDGAWGASSSSTWGSFISVLAERFYVIAPDLLGYGGSDKVVFLDRSPHDFRIAHLSEFVKSMNVTRPIHVVGNSFGGSNALRSLAKPGSFKFRSVVSIAGSGGPGRTQVAIDELGRWDGTSKDLERVLQFLVDDYPGYADQLAERMKWAVNSGHYKAVLAPTISTPQALKQKVSDPWPSQIADSEVPILLVKCLRDELLDPQWAADLKISMPRTEIAEIDCKHAPQLDHPDELRQVLFKFFDALPALDDKDDVSVSHGR